MAEYWVIDHIRRTLTVDRARAEQVIHEPETYRTELMPGFELLLARLLAVADEMR